ncbi:MAG: radical SAM family heme chaperone HemW [Proteobacteria bacterium]|nr:radical SAM family heme chaperone HemW [Pseudomonadota bacterium]
MSLTPPLSLYVHMPWCTRKCPYCDFNSHELRGSVNEREYVKALLADLQQDATLIQGREIETIFIGGGTPSLFSGDAIASLLEGISTRIDCAANLEVTMEANPGSSELRKFSAFRSAGVNRISIGVQSFTSKHLQALGRVHSAKEALKAAAAASQAGFKRINLDIMYALSGQTVGEASRDVEQAVAINPEHLSCYQLTIEPNTQFHAQPPKLPDEELGWEIQQTVHQLLSSADYQQYEVSAWATAGAECRHNLNYWRFGDYLGIGAGAHGKVSRLDGSIERYWKQKHPNKYLQSSQSNARFGGRAGIIGQKQLGFEFLLNALRLKQGFEIELFEQRTGLKIESLAPTLSKQFEKGWLIESGSTIKCSEIGYRFLDDLLTEYLPPP